MVRIVRDLYGTKHMVLIEIIELEKFYGPIDWNWWNGLTNSERADFYILAAEETGAF